jgi:hypothetical protein
METNIKINTDSLNMEFLEGIKKLFPHQEIQISIHATDETDRILSSPQYANEILDRINEFEQKGEVKEMSAKDLL